MSSQSRTTKRRRAPEPLEGDTDRGLEQSVEKLRPFLRRVARVLALGDRDVAADLYQLAITFLWKLDPSRFDEHDGREQTFLYRSLVNHMRNAMAAEAKSRHHPLVPRFR